MFVLQRKGIGLKIVMWEKTSFSKSTPLMQHIFSILGYDAVQKGRCIFQGSATCHCFSINKRVHWSSVSFEILLLRASTAKAMTSKTELRNPLFRLSQDLRSLYSFSANADPVRAKTLTFPKVFILIRNHIIMEKKMNLSPMRCMKSELVFMLKCQGYIKSIITVIHSCFSCRK